MLKHLLLGLSLLGIAIPVAGAEDTATGDADFPQLSEKYAAVDTEVDTMSGCVGGREAVSAIVKRIQGGKYGRPGN